MPAPLQNSSYRPPHEGILPGQYHLTETGLYYNGHRTYDPQTGGYLEPDPIGLAGGSYSTYSYVGDDPDLEATEE